MNHLGTVQIETNRLLLRRFTERDAVAAYHNWTSDEEVTAFLQWPTHDSIETTAAVLNRWIESYERKDFYRIIPTRARSWKNAA